VQCYIFGTEYTILFSIVQAPSVKNLIFDLGGVLLDLSVDQTIDAFSRLSGMDKEKVKTIFVSSPEFEAYESGDLDDNQFRDFVRKAYNISAKDEELDRCWNAMLLTLPIEKLKLLETLKTAYNLFLLSNTNNIHLRHINEVILRSVTGETDLDRYFHKAYYSHRMNKRKPEAEIFRQVLDENNLDPSQTLFLDDNLLNVQGASSLGIQTLYVTSADFVLNVFAKA
jgi:HAD superfamily hydrolase (TIGR01509 family)